MIFLPHQITKASQALALLKASYLVYIQGKPRSGKTATALKVAEDTRLGRWLILCPKNAIPGWNIFLNDVELNLEKHYTVINYEQLYKRTKVGDKSKYKLKLRSQDFDGVILDEAHNFGTLAKPSIRIKLTKLFAHHKPLILLSGTAVVESPCGIYHQVTLTKYSPFSKYKNFYDFHKVWGIPYYIKAAGRDIQQYDRYKPELLEEIAKFSVYMTQEEAGIKLTVTDKLHYVELTPKTKEMYNEIMKHKMIELEPNPLICDSVMKERTSLHMLESGVVKVDEELVYLGNLEKIDYIKANFEDKETTGIMAHFIGERELLKKHFKKAQIYSSTSHAEGVDLSHLDNFIIMSSGYSGAKFIQRRERISNINGSMSNVVHHILVKNAISDQVYKKVSKKLDFNNSTYVAGLL